MKRLWDFLVSHALAGLFVLAVLALDFVVLKFGPWQQAQRPIDPPPTFDYAFGWTPDPAAVEEVQRDLAFRVFADTPAGKSQDPLPAHVYLWEAFRKVDPKGPPSKNQGSIGSCVSFGTNNAVLRTMALQIALLGAQEELKDISEEVTYGGSRVEVGQGKIRGDGSVGAWAARFVKEWGVVPREKVGAYDLTIYDVSRCRQFGTGGVPNELEAAAKLHPVKSVTLVQTWEDAKKSLASGYAIAVCSGQGFSMQRDSNGVARAQGSWAHCMCLDGFHTEGGKEWGHIENSWGADAHRGPVGWGNPSSSGFWAESAVVNRMLRSGDSWAFSAVQGFPARNIDWFVLERHHQIPFGLQGNRFKDLAERRRTNAIPVLFAFAS